MPGRITLGQIEKEIEGLTTLDQLKLLERLAHQLSRKRIAVRKDLSWSELYGLGKEL